jgi:hypothetical protein
MQQLFIAVPQSLSLLFAKRRTFAIDNFKSQYFHTFKTSTPSGTFEMKDKRILPETGVELEVQLNVQSPFQEMLPHGPL